MGEAEVIAEWLGSRVHGSVEDGLSEAELARAEATFGLAFPPLWREVLRLVHPVRRFVAPQPGFQSPTTYPDWRLRDEARTRLLIDVPVAGLFHDVEDNDFWWYAWGARPAAIADRLAVARRELARVPALAPLFGHLYVAAGDSPVYRIVQADVRIAARTLAGLPVGERPATGYWPVGDVPFWSELHAWSTCRGSDSPDAARFGALGTGGFGS